VDEGQPSLTTHRPRGSDTFRSIDFDRFARGEFLCALDCRRGCFVGENAAEGPRLEGFCGAHMAAADFVQVDVRCRMGVVVVEMESERIACFVDICQLGEDCAAHFDVRAEEGWRTAGKGREVLIDTRSSEKNA
jgi:hypothetical protein